MPTIAAIATAPGSGGIGIIRLSGPDALAILDRMFRPAARNFSGFKPWTLHRGRIVNGAGQMLDDSLAVYMPGPATFTGEDVVEFHCHGGRLLLSLVLETALGLGARAAGPGEFSRRAFLNGRMDLTKAEAVAEIIAAPSARALDLSLDRLAGHLADCVTQLKSELDDLRAQLCAALDFDEEEFTALSQTEFDERLVKILDRLESLIGNARRNRVFQDGLRIVLAGPVNAGKSSLFNALAGKMRALVSEKPGTTRDYIEQELDFNGLPVCLVDTAGFRRHEAVEDELESLGIARSRGQLKEAGMIWLVMDSAEPARARELISLIRGEAENVPLLLVWNKTDLASPPELPDCPQLGVSALSGENLAALVETVSQTVAEGDWSGDRGVSPNARQAQLLELAAGELRALGLLLKENPAYDLWASHLDQASAYLASILGLASHDELLDSIFSRFCIGK